MFEIVRRLESVLETVGGFEKVSEDRWVESVYCEVCLGHHLKRTVSLSQLDYQETTEIPLGSRVRLSGGTNLVSIDFGTICLEEPFKNLTTLLVRSLGMSPVTEYQVFDSMSGLLDALRFSIPGSFYEWDGPELGASEDWAAETGHLIKMHFQRKPESPIVDFAIDLNESNNFKSEQFGLAFSRFGLLVTFWGADMRELEVVQRMFEGFIDDYRKLVGGAPSEQGRN